MKVKEAKNLKLFNVKLYVLTRDMENVQTELQNRGIAFIVDDRGCVRCSLTFKEILELQEIGVIKEILSLSAKTYK